MLSQDIAAVLKIVAEIGSLSDQFMFELTITDLLVPQLIVQKLQKLLCLVNHISQKLKQAL